MNDVRYVSVESTTCFSFFNLAKKIKRDLRLKFPDLDDDEFDKKMHESLKTFKLNNQEFEYHSIKNHLGGARWFVKCPKCGSDCLKLFLPSKHKDREQKYYCKKCHKLKNISLLLGASKRYKEVVKPLRKLEKIKSQVLSKKMTPERAAPLLDEYERIERELKISPAYRLWKFQNENVGSLPE